jgi:hypothetical protein
MIQNIVSVTADRAIIGKNHPTQLTFSDIEHSFFAGAEVEYTITADITAVDDMYVYFGIGYTQQGKTSRSDSNIGSDRKPANGWMLRVMASMIGGSEEEMNWYGSADYFGHAHDIHSVTVKCLASTLEFKVKMRFSADSLGLNNAIHPGERYSKTTGIDSEKYGLDTFGPSLWNQYGDRYLAFSVWADVEGSLSTTEFTEYHGTYALPVVASVGKSDYANFSAVARISGRDDQTAQPNQDPIQKLRIQPGANNEIQIDLAVTSLPVGSSSSGDLSGQFSVVLIEPNGKYGKPWEVNSPSEMVYVGSGTVQAGRFSMESFTSGSFSVASGLASWTNSVSAILDAGSMKQDKEYFLLLNACVWNSSTEEVFLVNSQFLQVEVLKYEDSEAKTITDIFKAGLHCKSVEGKVLSNYFLNSAFTSGIPGAWATEVPFSINLVNAIPYDRLVIPVVVRADKWDSIRPAMYSAAQWRGFMKAVRIRVIHEWETAGSVKMQQVMEYGANVIWPDSSSSLLALEPFGNTDNLEVYDYSTGCWLNKIITPNPVENHEKVIEYWPGSMINGTVVNKRTWDAIAKRENATGYLTPSTCFLKQTTIEGVIDFQFDESRQNDSIEAVFFKSTITYKKAQSANRTSIGFYRDDSTNQTYSDADKLSDKNRIVHDLGNAEKTIETYSINCNKSALVIIEGPRKFIRQHTIGLVNALYSSGDYSEINETSDQMARNGAALNVLREAVALDIPNSRFFAETNV